MTHAQQPQKTDWENPTPSQAIQILHATLDGGPTPQSQWQAALRELATLTTRRVWQLEEDARAAEQRETKKILAEWEVAEDGQIQKRRLTSLESAIVMKFDTDETENVVRHYRQQLDAITSRDETIEERLAHYLENSTHAREEACPDRLIADIAVNALADVNWRAIAHQFVEAFNVHH